MEKHEHVILTLSCTLNNEEERTVRAAISKALRRAFASPTEDLDQQLSAIIKVDLEVEFKSEWNCVVGGKFGLTVNCDENKYGQFYVEEVCNVFVFKSPTMRFHK